MKKIYYLIIGAILSSSIVSCKDEVVIPVEDKRMADSLVSSINTQAGLIVEANTQLNSIKITSQKLTKTRDSLNAVGNQGETKVLYTVNVLSFANSALTNGRTSGLSGATVTFSQNGTTQSKATDGGLVSFDAVNGSATVNISAADHGDVEYFVQLYGYSNNGTINASSQVFLFPNNASSGAATISGSVMGNLSTLNDTLGRVYGAAAGAELEGKYISKPGAWDSYNYTQYDYTMNRTNIYGTNNHYTQGVSFEKVPTTVKIYAIPTVPTSAYNDGSNYSSISSITYRGIIASSNVDANGNYSIPVFARAEGGTTIALSSETYIWGHERLTTSSGNDNEPGSVEKTFRSYNIGTATASDLVKRVISTNYKYEAYFPTLGTDNTKTLTVRSNENVVRNVYFFPITIL